MERVEDLRERIERRVRQLGDSMPGRTAAPAYFELLVELALDLAARLERVEMKLDGVCPGCRTRPVKLALTDVDLQYPEYAKRLREQGINPSSGHRLTCTEDPHP